LHKSNVFLCIDSDSLSYQLKKKEKEKHKRKKTAQPELRALGYWLFWM